jgi:hypothetical protein
MYCHDVAGLDERPRNGPRPTVDRDVPVIHQLPGFFPGGTEAESIDDVVQTALEQPQQRLSRYTGLPLSAFEDPPELPLLQPIDSPQFLLLSQLQTVFRRAVSPLAVLARGIAAPLNGALLRHATGALEEELLSLAPAQPANWTTIFRH